MLDQPGGRCHNGAMKMPAQLVCIFVLLAPAGLLARDDMSGVWKEEYTETIVSVEEWGKECGDAPRSPGRKKRKLLYTVEDRQVDLMFTGPGGKSFASSACQSPNRRLKAKERNLKDRLHLVNCATPETAKSYESGLYSFRFKSANRIEYRETTRFVRNVKGAICSHTRRTRRLYTRQKGVKAPVVGTKVDAPREDPCETPGPAVTLSLTPAKSVVRPGEKVCLQAAAKDANGCAADASLTWGRGDTPRGIKLNIAGCLTATRKAKSGTHAIRLAAGKAEAEFTLVVVRKVVKAPPPREPVEEPPPIEEPPEEDPEEPEEPPPPPPPAEKPPEPPPPTEAKEEEPPAWILPAAIGGGVFVILVVILIIFLTRKRTTPMAAEPTHPEPLRPSEEEEKVFCTNCGKQIPPEATFCPYCGHQCP
jgi:hypothetical protein